MTATKATYTTGRAKVTVAAVFISCLKCNEAIPDQRSGSEMHAADIPCEVVCRSCGLTLTLPKTGPLRRY